MTTMLLLLFIMKSKDVFDVEEDELKATISIYIFLILYSIISCG